MRNVLVATILLVTVSAAHAQSSAGAIVSTYRLMAAEKLCPKYRVNLILLEGELGRFGLSMEEALSEKYASVRDKTIGEVKEIVAKTDGKSDFCNLMWDSFGEGGKVPGLLKRRD